VLRYSKFTERLPTRAFLVPLEEDEEVEVELSKGNVVSIKFKAKSELQSNGKRCERLQQGRLFGGAR
jgi:pyruvate carboxylase